MIRSPSVAAGFFRRMTVVTLHLCPAPQWRRPSLNTQKKEHFFRTASTRYRDLAVVARAQVDAEGVDGLAWVTQARRLAIESMSFRDFTDADFEALLPPKLRESKKAKAKKSSKVKAKAFPENIKQKRKEKKKQEASDVDDALDGVGAAPTAEAIDPELLTALASKFNAAREAGKMGLAEQVAQNYEKAYGKAMPQMEFSVSYEDTGLKAADDELPSQRFRDPKFQEIEFNKDLVACRDPDEVLEVASRGGERLLTPINVATALHRIAKHMVNLSMPETKRLKVARQKEMCELVATAMQRLPECSAQGVSNIAWALSKVGGRLLYLGEMELIAAAGAAKWDEMAPQNVANLAAAFATMQHDSPGLFEKLALRAAEVVKDLRPQELAQVLWAFASFSRIPQPLLNSLDDMLQEDEAENSQGMDGKDESTLLTNLRLEELSSIAWSYCVFGELQRPFFAYVCREVSKSCLNQDKSRTGQHTHACQLIQLHQTKMCLKLEWSHLELSLGERVEQLAAAAWEKEKKGRKSTSLFQKEMEYFLAYTGRTWLPEHTGADYSLDFALEEEKIGIEVNGPTHFARNTGEPLGHTTLKRRLLHASGWKVVSASYHEWEGLQGEAEHGAYVKQLVSTVLE